MRSPGPWLLASLLALGALAPRRADAFCGFYVAGADAKLYNNATQVVLMREGTRTVLSMQNNYEGPPQDFAMVVPVPVVLREGDVRTLDPAIFARVDRLAAPRLVEYWERDPCAEPYLTGVSRDFTAAVDLAPGASRDAAGIRLGVTVEERFDVGEYKVEILSARASTGLDTWLRRSGYRIPPGAEAALRPYVQAGMKFFVAKVDIRKVRFDARGQATLSPLRFHYDSETFTLPVRLGLLNSRGTQDLIVHVLGRARYQVANYPNVAIPTNLELAAAARDAFGPFFVALLGRTLSERPRAVVTEYAWSAASCDPCPEEPLDRRELDTLGRDVLPGDLDPQGLVLTRLHARYGPESLGEDLVFAAARPITGGQEIFGGDGRLLRGAEPSDANAFQARYVIRHRWTGPIACAHPQPGIWEERPPEPARDLALVPRDAPLEKFLVEDPSAAAALPDVAAPPPLALPAAQSCGGCDAGGGASLLGALLGALRRRRRSR